MCSGRCVAGYGQKILSFAEAVLDGTGVKATAVMHG